ncbi:Maltose/maltodextrin ABC transporter, permease protein MalG [Microbacterium esteraromaticum]|uniref:Maltose/maltodextrin ABC transporter, permease protein MalG n=1 Tax=Microbacterium esteraromaticum TaxID=57043 RepID=A0A1R4K0H7_9MICO|nr:carbohydrate ABC transporter permease [Microbacterium esteraromaticum]SJN37718.1 Maltose/maltodextrin ABC transporter, permease protein MalG [Microbacterium esteraromaticum]
MTTAPVSRRRLVERPSKTAYTTLGILSLFAFIPVLWMVLTSFTSGNDIFQFPPAIFSRGYTIDHYVAVITDPVLMRFVLNGLFVSITTAALSLVVGFAAGYSFSKFRYIGRSPFMFAILLAQMVPEVLLLLTLYTSFNAFGLLNTYAALILSYTTFTLPLSVWMMKNTFDAVPDELLEAARVDGASEWRIMWSVLLPVTRTSLIAVGLFSFIRAWNDLAFALTLVGTEQQTLPAGLSLTFLGEFQNSYGPMLAASTVTSIPVVVIFLVLQKHFVSGALSGSVK